MLALPHIGEAVHNLQPLHGSPWQNWSGFVGIVLALSGVEAIANSTGVMKLNPGSTDEHPNVSKTSTPAILWVMLEVCLFTALLGLAMHALPGLHINRADPANPDVDAPGQAGVRDYMLRYMAEIFVGHSFGAVAAHIAGWTVSIVFGLLLLSAVNTAIVDLIAISFLMSRDGELPPAFQKLNSFGVPNISLFVATIVPAALVMLVSDVSGLADLYAVGVVGAIATNLGASSTDGKLKLLRWERGLMFCTFIVMVCIEVSEFVVKPKARVFAMAVLVVGLILRGLASERAQRKKAADAQAAALSVAIKARMGHGDFKFNPPGAASGEPMLAAIRGVGRTLDFAIDEAKKTNRPLYILYVREQPVIHPEDRKRKWMDDDEAREIFAYASDKADGHTILPAYAISDSPADTIVDIAATVGSSYLIVGAPQRNMIVNLLRGNIIRNISDILPEEIHLLVYA